MSRIKLSRTSLKRRDHVTQSLHKAAEKQGHIILPSTQLHLQDILRRAKKSGTIETPEQMVICKVALNAAGIRGAQDENRERVTVHHLEEGWRHYYAYGGNCPPHRCLFRSVISRHAQLKEEDQIFAQLEDSL
jgi:hypothetical protein